MKWPISEGPKVYLHILYRTAKTCFPTFCTHGMPTTWAHRGRFGRLLASRHAPNFPSSKSAKLQPEDPN